MKTAAFQCPDSGLIVKVSINHAGIVKVEGDEDDWNEMEADTDTIRSTREWIRDAQRAVQGLRHPTIEEIKERLQDVELDSLYPLTWR